MDIEEFKTQNLLLDKVITEVQKLNKFAKFEKVTFLYFDCSNLENLEILLKHPLTKNIVIVSDEKFARNNVITMKKETWKENLEIFTQLTKNSIVISENKELVLNETYSFLQMCSKFYPVVSIYSNEQLRKLLIKEKGFSSHSNKNYYCNINLKLKDYKSYSVNDFLEIKDKINEIENLGSLLGGKDIFNKNSDTEQIDLDIRPSFSPKRFDNSSSEEEFSFLNNLKSPTVKNVLDKYNIPSSKKWRQQFYDYLKDLLSRFFPQERLKLIDVILNNQTINDYWIPCFTHFTANPTQGKNYESLETIGDVTMGYCFKFFISQREPLADAARISNLHQKYMSKIFQSKLSKKMKLPEWLISCGINADRMDNNEDLMEAFCGTIDQILYKKSKKIGLGVLVIYNLLTLIFKDFNFETEEKQISDPDRTYVDQLFSGQYFRPTVKYHYTMLKRPKEIPEDVWEKIVPKINKMIEPEGIHPVIIKRDTSDHQGIVNESNVSKNGKVSVTITILKDYAVLARKAGIDIPARDIIIGQSVKSTKKIAEKEAYSQAREYVISKGMTKEWKDRLKNRAKNLNLENLDKVEEKARIKYPEIESIKITRPKTMKVNGVDCVVYQIIGEDKKGTKISVFTLPSQDKNFEQEVINEYLRS